jgi:hypothetical protein
MAEVFVIHAALIDLIELVQEFKDTVPLDAIRESVPRYIRLFDHLDDWRVVENSIRLEIMRYNIEKGYDLELVERIHLIGRCLFESQSDIKFIKN